MKNLVGVLAGMVLSAAAYAQEYTENQRLEAEEQAKRELLRAEIVEINKDLIRVRTITLDEEGTKQFISTSMSDLTQCGAFRVAQARALEEAQSPDADAYRDQGAYLEMHLLLLARAAGRVLGEPDLEAQIKKELADKGTDWIKRHYQAIAYETDAQKEHVDYWEERCTQMEENLSRQLDTRAQNQVTADAINERTAALLEETSANR